MGYYKKHIYVDLEHEGPDQEPDDSAIVDVAAPLLANLIVLCLVIACAIVWCGIGAGRI